MNDTIIALSSAHGRSAIAVIRLSGKDSLLLLEGAMDKNGFKHAKAVHGTLDVGTLKDDVVALYFKAPHSYTGEDVVEIFTHGSPVITEAVIRYFLGKGARLAERGEFTRRAFENGKVTLSESEGIIDLIDAKCESAARVAYNLAGGALTEKIGKVRNELTLLAAAVNVEIDYPEEDVGASGEEENLRTLERIKGEVVSLMNTYENGKKLTDGVSVVIAGVPNAGKSTLMNALVGYERAIVTEEAGTTRDTVEASYIYKGVLFNVTDTAGVRGDATSKAEIMGIERSVAAVRGADVAVALDGFECDNPHTVPVHTKADLSRFGGMLNVCAPTGEGLDELKERIYKESSVVPSGEVMLTNLRQYECLKNCADALDGALDCMKSGAPAEILSGELLIALSALSGLDGARATEEVVNGIFARFCVGK